MNRKLRIAINRIDDFEAQRIINETTMGELI